MAIVSVYGGSFKKSRNNNTQNIVLIQKLPKTYWDNTEYTLSWMLFFIYNTHTDMYMGRVKQAKSHVVSHYFLSSFQGKSIRQHMPN